MELPEEIRNLYSEREKIQKSLVDVDKCIADWIDNNSDFQCTICTELSDFVLSCGHRIHSECVKKSKKIKKGQFTCPACTLVVPEIKLEFTVPQHLLSYPEKTQELWKKAKRMAFIFKNVSSRGTECESCGGHKGSQQKVCDACYNSYRSMKRQLPSFCKGEGCRREKRHGQRFCEQCWSRNQRHDNSDSEYEDQQDQEIMQRILEISLHSFQSSGRHHVSAIPVPVAQQTSTVSVPTVHQTPVVSTDRQGHDLRTNRRENRDYLGSYFVFVGTDIIASSLRDKRASGRYVDGCKQPLTQDDIALCEELNIPIDPRAVHSDSTIQTSNVTITPIRYSTRPARI